MRGGRAARAAIVILPCLLVAILAAPTLPYMLPAFEDHASENYQPLQALKFYQSLGADFHKYGPMRNFLLLPPYGALFAWWWAEGSFGPPSSDFPYGFHEPLRQISALIFAGRALFLLIFLACSAYLLRSLQLAVASGAAVAAAFLIGAGTSHIAAYFAANTAPDGPMLAFALASLGTYTRILALGATPGRLVALSLLAVFSISSKELAGFLYLLPYLGLGAVLWREQRATPEGRRRSARLCALALSSGVGAYLLLDVVYAPGTWWLRMQHWLAGSGADPDVWLGIAPGESRSAAHLAIVAASVLGALGPGGLPLAGAAIAALCVRRPPGWLLSLLPSLSFVGFGILPLGYASDEFLAPAIAGLIPALAFGLDALERALAGRRALRAAWRIALVLGLAANAVYASFAWLQLESQYLRVAERILEARGPGTGAVNLLDLWPRVPGKTRLEAWGHPIDTRSIAELMDADPGARPDWILAERGLLVFLAEARSMPARAALLRAENGIDSSRWSGVEALGYRLEEVVETPSPRWFPFDWMPGVAAVLERSPVHVYRRDPLARRAAG